VCEVIRLRATTSADLEVLGLLSHRLRDAGLSVPLSLSLPISLLPLPVDVPPIAKIVIVPESTVSESAWCQQAEHALAVARQGDRAVEWALALDTIPAFLQRTCGATLEGLAQTACRLARIARQAAAQAVMISLQTPDPVHAYRYVAARLDAQGFSLPLHLQTPPLTGYEETLFQASIWLGALLCDGLGDSLQITSDLDAEAKVRLSYNILQAARLRMSKTEFISCPSCGRTLFNLQTTTERIKARMSHLKDVKLAIMGCIVNGPGEMADADFGYVGSGPGKISLYVGKTCVERNIPESQADEHLIQLIQAHGKWVEPL
jgi:1-hydroxy-2-methyl-2-(E)-butenyl 4-diphosphate synthase